MAFNILGVIFLLALYILMLAIGLWAARRTGFNCHNLRIDEHMLANRSIGVSLGCFTLTATWVGGGYINGTTEEVALNGGLVWCQAPLGYALSLVFGAIFFVDKMRDSGLSTMLDPFHWKFGDLMNCLLYIPALTGDIFWSAAILQALGATLRVILEMNLETAIIISATTCCIYTLVGGLYSVAYTDVVQLICMFIGLWLCVPFSMTHDAVSSITACNNSDVWLGELTADYAANYIDYGLLLIFGGIPWQVYWQRILSAKTMDTAKTMSFLAALGCIIMAIPAILMGAVAASTDWNATGYGYKEIREKDKNLVLPLVMRHLCPDAVTFVGLGAISASVMSSTDSSVLSSSTLFTRNVYGVVYTRYNKKKPSEVSQVWVMRRAQVAITALACFMAIQVDSIYDLWLLCSDFVYVILFPQLVCVMYLKKSNSYGSFVAFVLGLLFRLLGGDNSLDIPAVIKYPWYQEGDKVQLFPFRTLSMMISMFSLIAVSYFTDFIFTKGILPLSLDFYGCFQGYIGCEQENAILSCLGQAFLHLSNNIDRTGRRSKSVRAPQVQADRNPDAPTRSSQLQTHFKDSIWQETRISNASNASKKNKQTRHKIIQCQ